MKKLNPVASYLLQDLGSSPTELTEKKVRKIADYLPVPKDFKILWAEILSFGNYPSGIVITDGALIIKAPKVVIKEKNAFIRKENRKVKEEEKKEEIKVYYRIIPWDMYDPEEFHVEKTTDKKGNEFYYLESGEEKIVQFSSFPLYRGMNNYRNRYLEAQEQARLMMERFSNSAVNSINARAAVYCAMYGKANINTGHGIFAEDVGAILDRLYGEKVTVVGRDNAKNGADKIVNQAPVQCKYCKSYKQTINACFTKNPFTGSKFRYYDLDERPMVIEVPKDQYLDAVDFMKEKIRKGMVDGVTNPDEATAIIRPGKLNYRQAVNLAKAGTFESLKYDFFSGSVRCLSTFGISFIFTFAQVFWKTKDVKKAAKCALVTGMEVYGVSIIASVISSQLARTGFYRLFEPMVKSTLSVLNPALVQNMANQTRALAGLKPISGAAAQSYYVKFLSSQIATECILFLVFSAGDIFNVLDKRISTGQFWKNMSERLAATIGGSVAASVVGGIVAAAVNPIVGGIAGLTAGFAGGTTSGFLAKTIGHWVKEDDAVILGRMFNAVLINTAMEYLLSTDEQERLLTDLNNDTKELTDLMKNLYQADTQVKLISDYLRPKVKRIVASRKQISQNDEDTIRLSVSEFIETGELAYEV